MKLSMGPKQGGNWSCIYFPWKSIKILGRWTRVHMQTLVEWIKHKNFALQEKVKKPIIKNHLDHTWYIWQFIPKFIFPFSPIWGLHKVPDAPPSSLLDPKKGPTILKSGSSWNLVPLPAFSTKGGWDERGESSGIRLGRGTTYLVTRSCIKVNYELISSHLESLLVLGQTTGNTNSLDSPWLGLGETTTFPHIIFCMLLCHTRIRMTFNLGTPKEESWNCPGLDSRDFGSS